MLSVFAIQAVGERALGKWLAAIRVLGLKHESSRMRDTFKYFPSRARVVLARDTCFGYVDLGDHHE